MSEFPTYPAALDMAQAVPQNRQAEESVLGSVLVNPEVYQELSIYLLGSDFFLHRNRWIWESFGRLFDDQRPIDLVTVAEELERAGQLSEAGGQAYLTGLINNVPSSVHSDAYGRMVKEASIRRAGVELAQRIVKASMSGEIEQLQEMVEAAELPMPYEDDHITGADAMREFMTTIGKERVHFRTAFPALDHVHLLEPDYLNVLAGRPGMGKSLLAHQIIAAVALEYPDHQVVLCSPEMSSLQVARRIAQAQAGVSNEATINDDVLRARLMERARVLSGQLGNIRIIDKSITSLELQGYCRHIVSQFGPISLIVTDHVRLLSDHNREERHRLGAITFRHKLMAREFQTSVLLLAQLNRAVEGRDNKRPSLADLRDSGEIEENTDKVTFIFRQGYYDYMEKGGDQSGEAEIFGAKNRDGGFWGARLYFAANRGPAFGAMAYNPAIPAPAAPVHHQPPVQEFSKQEEIPF
jgi:replicative DNA helicase